MQPIYFAKTKPGAIIPQKREEDAGYDVYACLDEDYVKLQPLETKALPTGIASACDAGYYFQIQERGSTGTKGIARRCGVIDSGYRGEWFIPLTNLNTKPLYLAKPEAAEMLCAREDCIVYPVNKAICQAVLLPVPKTLVREISYDDLLQMQSERGDKSLGSSEK